MHDKSDALPGDFFAIPDIHVIRMHGRDAIAFAQAQFMNDVAGLATGEWQWNGWLTPKGRVVALFALLRVDDGTLRLLLLDADPTGFIAGLQRFVFRSKVTLTPETDVTVAGAFATPATARGALAAVDAEGATEFDVGGTADPRTLRVGGGPATIDPVAHGRWRALDLAHGLPRLEPSQLEQWTPQQLSLDRLRAFSVRKGCYPGQEIVARTHFLGQVKRGLARLHTGATVVSGGDEVTATSGGGRIVCSQGAEALAVLPLDPAPAGLQVGGATAEVLPLLDGLAR
ncbi:folate-binding protein YgfZ [Luteimonas yindakuii]|uniref:Folate-binding protein YgfZ n=1 Tax=Luteimonas yindakuii TaxID=2565782 RepID=A0A4Z1RDZ9_9GAMM|nr:folate-binding protein YgfZ [Luteimonas yindakuii]TKS54393.1 folate-binding protein YgfZ [Luteimonas yindakuii]